MGIDEEPVDEQEAADRGRKPGPETADGSDADDEEQEEEHRARKLERIAELGQDEREQGQADPGHEPPERLPASREGSGIARAGSEERVL